jgi:hypothetical protein
VKTGREGMGREGSGGEGGREGRGQKDRQILRGKFAPLPQGDRCPCGVEIRV